MSEPAAGENLDLDVVFVTLSISKMSQSVTFLGERVWLLKERVVRSPARRFRQDFFFPLVFAAGLLSLVPDRIE